MLMKDYSYCFKLSWLGCLFKPKAACVGNRTAVPTPLSSNAKSLNGSWARATSTTHPADLSQVPSTVSL